MGKIWFSRLLFEIHFWLFLENLHCISFRRLWSKKGSHWNSANTGFNPRNSAQWDSTQRYSVHTGFHRWYSVSTRFNLRNSPHTGFSYEGFVIFIYYPYLSFLLPFFVTNERLIYNLLCPFVNPWFFVLCHLLMFSYWIRIWDLF